MFLVVQGVFNSVQQNQSRIRERLSFTGSGASPGDPPPPISASGSSASALEFRLLPRVDYNRIRELNSQKTPSKPAKSSSTGNLRKTPAKALNKGMVARACRHARP